MYQKKSRQCCALMLIVSVCLRVCMFLGLDEQLGRLVAAAVQRPETAEFLLFLETGQRVELTAPEPPVLVVEVEKPEPMPVPVTVRVKEPTRTAAAGEIVVTGQCTYAYDKEALLLRQTSLDFSGEGPQILIVHSHSTEAYTPSDGLTYEEVPSYRTLDETRNVIAVGEVLANALRQQGMEVIHDTAVNDYPDYNTSYWNTLQRIEAWKSQYPGLQLVLDIHRDAVENEDGEAVALLSTQEGMSAAQLMLVVGTDEGGLEHPDWQENLANALKLQSVIMGQYPGLCRKLDLRTERFNQHVAPGALLIEVGTNGNTLTQAKASAVLLADAIVRTVELMEESKESS